MRNVQELAALRALENSIKKLAAEFQGRSALNFYHESELAAHLIVNSRASPSIIEYVGKARMYLAHLEWPCLPRRRIDLVLWRPGTCSQAFKHWRYKGTMARSLPLLAAVQVKRGPGGMTSLSDSRKDLRDLEALYVNEDLQSPILYFLEWVDHNLQGRHKNDRIAYHEMQSMLSEWCDNGPDRRALMISRDKVGFAYPNGSWLIDVLPQGTIETI